ncbi:MAG TPA: protein translocase subunit SecF [Candidatus Paceibacterota bacterium]|nr:protein translocase subunit SecF [Candidatus Paceibacterota bacterium]
MLIIKYRAFFFWLTGLILAGAIGALVFFGLPLSIDFTGGSLVEVAYQDTRPDVTALKERVAAAGFDDLSLRESGEKGITVRAHTLTPEEHNALLLSLSNNGAEPVTELRFNSIGPSLGSELAIKALYAIGAVMLAIMFYIALVFRKVSRPVPSWGYGLVVILMLAIDIIVPAGFFAAYAHFTGAQADALFVVALLALLGYCVNDVIIVFDRVRERLKLNLEKNVKEDFETTVGISIDQTLGRSINTSLTVALALLAIILFGAEATRDFALVMLVGVVVGTFSSICRSAPLLIPIAKQFSKK